MWRLVVAVPAMVLIGGDVMLDARERLERHR